MYVIRDLTLHKCGASYTRYVLLTFLWWLKPTELVVWKGKCKEWGTHGQSWTRNNGAKWSLEGTGTYIGLSLFPRVLLPWWGVLWETRLCSGGSGQLGAGGGHWGGWPSRSCGQGSPGVKQVSAGEQAPWPAGQGAHLWAQEHAAASLPLCRFHAKCPSEPHTNSEPCREGNPGGWSFPVDDPLQIRHQQTPNQLLIIIEIQAELLRLSTLF